MFFVYTINIFFCPIGSEDLCVFVCVNECVLFGYEQSTQMSHLLCTGLEATHTHMHTHTQTVRHQ